MKMDLIFYGLVLHVCSCSSMNEAVTDFRHIIAPDEEEKDDERRCCSAVQSE